MLYQADASPEGTACLLPANRTMRCHHFIEGLVAGLPSFGAVVAQYGTSPQMLPLPLQFLTPRAGPPRPHRVWESPSPVDTADDSLKQHPRVKARRWRMTAQQAPSVQPFPADYSIPPLPAVSCLRSRLQLHARFMAAVASPTLHAFRERVRVSDSVRRTTVVLCQSQKHSY